MPDRLEQARPNYDGRVFGGEGQPDVYIPGDFWPKLAFFLFSVAMTIFGLWDLWEPTTRVFLGEVEEARVVRIVRESPGESPEVIRIRREIAEGDYSFSTIFRHYVEVIGEDGNPQEFEMAVASRRMPYALVNETFDVAYFPEGEYAYGVLHHRTWAFGAAFTLMGLTFLSLSWYILKMVGKPIVIDAEDPEQLAKEAEAEKREEEAREEEALERK